MIKKAIFLFMACAIVSCKNEVDSTPLDIKGAITTSRLIEDVSCGSNTYVFQIPFYKGNEAVQQRLNKEIISLITQDFIDVTYNKDASLNEIWEIFISDRERKICAGNMSGVTNIEIAHLSQNEGIVSYELIYTRNGEKRRLTKTYKKPELTELKISDLAKTNKIDDVRRIYDINLQQSVANLSLEIKAEEYNDFRAFMGDKVFNFSKEEFEQATLGIHIKSADSLMLQVSKRIDLPSAYPFLNEDVKVEINAKEMDYYLDLAPLKI